MRRSAVPRQTAGFSLFSFLDALLCTMGALILVLVVIVRQLETHYEDVAADKVASSADRQAERELLDLRISHLQAQRDKTEEDLRNRRLELGHVEEHSRELADRIKEIEATLAALAKGEANDPARAETQAKIDKLRRHARQLQDRLAEARAAAAAASEAYAIIPYEGPNQTRRRPIYIECRSDAILLQPEGIRLTEADFQGPLGPGNPLAAALRAAREHLAATSPADAKEREPYPLLLVRPSGIVSYYVALQSLKSWHSEFGYELVEEDWELAFPTPDVQLAQVEQRAVDNAREQLVQLAVAVPRTYGRDTRPSFAPPPDAEQGFYDGGLGARGAGARMGGPGGGRTYPYGGRRGGGNSGSEDYVDNPPGGAGSSDGSYGGRGNGGGSGYAAADGGGYPDELSLPAEARGGGPGGLATAADLDQIYGSAATASPSNGTGGMGGGYASGGDGTGDRVFGEQMARGGYGNGTGQPGSTDGMGGTPGGQLGTPGQAVEGMNGAAGEGGRPAASSNTLANNGSSPGGGGNGAGGSQQGVNANGNRGERENPFAPRNSYKGASPTQTASASGAGAPGGSASGSGSGGGGSSPSQGSQVSMGTPGGGGESAMGEDQGTPTATAHVGAQKSMADKRGENWGVPSKKPEAVAITRPIRVRCSANKLEVLAENNRSVDGRAIPLGMFTEDSVDQLVSHIWRRMEGWGIAGKNLYWHPVLQLEVTPDGQKRAEDLKVLLAGSGLDISEKAVVAPVAARSSSGETR